MLRQLDSDLETPDWPMRFGGTSADTGPAAIFGADGFIGRALTETLIRRGLAVRAVGRRIDQSRNAGDRAERARADLADMISVMRALDGVETVVQLASGIKPSSGNTRLLQDLDQEVVTQVRFLEACVSAGVKRVVFPSSGGAVYGRPSYIPIDEMHPTLPMNSYGLTKLTIERYLQLFAASHGLEFVILRVSNAYGPGQVFRKGQGLIARVIDQIKQGEPTVVFGDGTDRRDYLFIDDLSDGICRALICDDARNEVINLGAGISHSINDVMEMVSSLLGRELPVERRHARPTDVPVNCLNIDHAAAALGWQPYVDLRTGLQRTLQHHGLL